MKSQSILGVGADIEDVFRFRKLPYPKNKSFYQKIFTKKEIAYCLEKSDPSESFAARFAAKEAVIKALPKNFSNLKNIEVAMRGKKPQIKIKGFKVLVSLSHTKKNAIAFAICYG